jgi:hypothetical protein
VMVFPDGLAGIDFRSMQARLQKWWRKRPRSASAVITKNAEPKADGTPSTEAGRV